MWHAASTQKMTITYKTLGGRPDEDTSRVRPRRRRGENIITDQIEEIRCGDDIGFNWLRMRPINIITQKYRCMGDIKSAYKIFNVRSERKGAISRLRRR